MAETLAGYEPVIELTRGGIVECVHFGAMAVVDSCLLYTSDAADE